MMTAKKITITDIKVYARSETHSYVKVYTIKRCYETTWAGTPTREEVEAGFIEDCKKGRIRNWDRLY